MMIVIIIATVKLEVEQNVSGCGGYIYIVSTSIRFRQILVKFLIGSFHLYNFLLVYFKEGLTHSTYCPLPH